MALDADELIERLGLQPHPEGGWYAETWRAPAADGHRPTSTAIYFLLRAGERSHWHRFDADEVWLHHDGDPLVLRLFDEAADEGVDVTADGGADVSERVLGPDIEAGQQPQLSVPAGRWQAAETLGDWTLVSCVVAPGFEFDGFELAPPGWEPG
ncbi:MAG: cupin domain-containing protein [Acidimicrobiales bacterium]